jgi:hypothetical protein
MSVLPHVLDHDRKRNKDGKWRKKRSDYGKPRLNFHRRKRTMWERNILNYGNCMDDDGNPTGGHVYGPGLTIDWQDGPLGRPPKPATGVFVEDVIEAARQRLEFYQKASGGKFQCRENALAITKLEEALHWLTARRIEREARGVQGEHRA